MKKLIFFSLCCGLLLFTDCKKDRNTFVIKGRFLTSCDDPTPVVGAELYISASGGQMNPSGYTDSEGRFALTYEDVYDMGFISIKGSQSNGYGTLTYMTHMPKEKNLDIGHIYSADNYFFLCRVSVQRPTSQADTIFYEYSNLTGFKKWVVGPFQDGQIVDTLTYRGTSIYDKNFPASPTSPPSRNTPGLSYQVGSAGKYMVTNNDEAQECSRYNYFDFEVKD